MNYLEKKQFKKFEVKKHVKYEHICGELDFIADDTIFEIKASFSDIISKEYIL